MLETQNDNGEECEGSMCQDIEGEYVKFDDIKELLNTDARQLKAEIAALVAKFDHSSIIDCNGDLIWLLKQLRKLSAV
jgi:hypothetical protein